MSGNIMKIVARLIILIQLDFHEMRCFLADCEFLLNIYAYFALDAVTCIDDMD